MRVTGIATADATARQRAGPESETTSLARTCARKGQVQETADMEDISEPGACVRQDCTIYAATGNFSPKLFQGHAAAVFQGRPRMACTAPPIHKPRAPISQPRATNLHRLLPRQQQVEPGLTKQQDAIAVRWHRSIHSGALLSWHGSRSLPVQRRRLEES